MLYASTDSGFPDFKFRIDAGGMVVSTRFLGEDVVCRGPRRGRDGRIVVRLGRKAREPDAVMAVAVC